MGEIKLPKGFKSAGVACGIKKDGKKDLALILSESEANTAGVFTKNIVKGHSLKWTMKNIRGNKIRAVVINSGNANACVGEKGDSDAERMADLTARLAKCGKEQVLLGSTGVIGFPLPMEKIESGLQKAFSMLSTSPHDAACAIMTTDTYPKEISFDINLSGKNVTLYGMAKGSGMIHPNMATMIGVFLTDAAISKEMLQKALTEAVNKSFNRISVDGDTSVCDMVVILANGMAENEEISCENNDYATFVNALEKAAVMLSKMLVKDGEGATKLIEIRVVNAPDCETAHKITSSIAKSPLVKTAMFGQDANWGRILTAAGYSGADFNPDLVDILIGDLLVCQNGVGLNFDEEKALEILKKDEIKITVDLKIGSSEDTMWTCDFSYDYVRINGSYRT
ncbi:arginine biosynthesis bifunctional protein ArgJ [Thermoclostridium stercorarium subsp. stercorarium DSM 8532]|uniref:Arginine biosynthesis bifunctional protein ArgJ n=3 Tax=Thermoclostridium stercorarium TaxID=1510 RepID=L7VS47_THES1|nr:bifunctional glutamate N-acetyltransferase/amino-acid acetyltransferase ArgJ [Thermoclostridium stercorarium]AGC69166.1 arginine biosynthesis bifunctional protein ArgJ [Thermoclostridium stercorarium subsp. stercorarium DSM 8532]AGI40136.1 glutamate N-acetyltransferase [Thermoclostridium stercorarium subsp. stercorarium DSM 8532]ANW99446.1 ornithine acetyltransferase [Thermoclostridium stercorarium subsp. thermolacticum DSM 2910]ANX02073.1 ornithine acetyltransferase [Thermoclostridium sterc